MHGVRCGGVGGASAVCLYGAEWNQMGAKNAQL